MMRPFAHVVAASTIATLALTAGDARAQDGTQPAGTPAATPATEAPADPPKPVDVTADPAAPAADAPAADGGRVTENKPPEEAGGAVANPDPIDKRAQCPKDTLLCWQTGLVAAWPKLRVRPGFEYVDADPQILYVGENDGFLLDSARIGAEANFADVVRVRMTVDVAALAQGNAPNQPVTPLVSATRDAWVTWTPSTWFILQAGQQNMPSDYEGGDVDAVIPFTRRSVMAAGVRAGHGNAVGGLSPGRQIGIVLGSADGAKLGDIPIEYRLGVANGNGLNQLGNDNKLPATYLRLGTGFSDIIRVGVGGRFNPRTVGTLPNLYTETDYVGFADLALAVAGLELTVAGIGRQTALTTLIPDPANPAGQETSWGTAAWLGYKIGLSELVGVGVDVKPAVRFSFYDPSSAFATDQLMETTVGLRLDGDQRVMPLTFMIDYTFLTEVGDLTNNVAARDLANNRLTALFQIEL